MSQENRFYVYEFIRLDTNEPFYVGKGCGNRVNDIHRGRNKWFKNIVNKHEVVSRIIIDNLTEKEAYEAEVWFIYEYKHILNYELVNMDDGGQGAIGGKDNPMYGLKGELNPNYGIKASEERKQKISERLTGRTFSEEHINKIKAHAKTRDYNSVNNPNYGNGDKIKGGLNPSAKKYKVTNTDGLTTVYNTKNDVMSQYKISNHLLNKVLGKVIDVYKDFTRQHDKHLHLNGLLIEEIV